MEVALIVCAGWIFSVCLHEFGHAIVAYWGGDTSVKDKGYLTFNIFKYTDPGMSLIVPTVILMLGGIGLPGAAVYIDHSKLRNRLWETAVSAAGPIATLLSCLLFSLPFIFRVFPDPVPDVYWSAVAFLVQILVSAFLLNSLPIPGLDGYGVIEPWLPRSIREQLQKVSNIAFWGLILLLWTSPDANRAFWGLVDSITRLFHVPIRQADIGQALFMESRGWLVIGIIALLFVMKRHDDKSQPKDDLAPYLNAAKQRLSENKPLDAVEETNKALAIDPNFADAWHLRGVCFGLMNRNDEALENFSKALEINPEYADCWYNRACCYALQGRYDEALADLSRAIQLSPDTLREHAKQDVGFRPLRNDPRFQRLVSVSGS